MLGKTFSHIAVDCAVDVQDCTSTNIEYITSLRIVRRLEHVDDVPRWIFDTKGAAEGFVGRLAHGLNAIGNQCGVSSVRVVHHPDRKSTRLNSSHVEISY